MQLFTALLLLNHFITLRDNNFEFVGRNDVDSEETQVGCGVCILQNMIDHSCDPNLFTFVHNRHRVVFAKRPIKAGEQVSVHYGLKKLSGSGF